MTRCDDPTCWTTPHSRDDHTDPATVRKPTALDLTVAEEGLRRKIAAVAGVEPAIADVVGRVQPVAALPTLRDALTVGPEHRERMQRFETGRNDESDSYYVASTDRTILISQIDRARRELDLAARRAAEPPNAGLVQGDVVRPKWGQRSGRWLVLRTDHPFWEGAVRLRCLVIPTTRRKRKTWWRVGGEGWVRFMLEKVKR